MSKIIEHEKRKLLGHIMRMAENNEEDPLYQSTFTSAGNINVYRKKRVGRPRGWWAEDTMNIAMNWLQGEPFDRDDITHHIYLFTEAIKIVL